MPVTTDMFRGGAVVTCNCCTRIMSYRGGKSMALYRKFRREFNSFYEEMCKLYAKVKCEQRQDQLFSKKELKI